MSSPVTARRSKRRRRRIAVVVIPTLLGAVAVALIFTTRSVTNESVVAALEVTARLALAMFLVTFVARPLFDLTGTRWSRVLLTYRKWTGLSFALAMGFHLALILSLFLINAPLPPPMIGESDYLLGGPGLVAIAVLSVLSNTSVHRWMGQQRWRAVNLVGITWIWTVFVMCFVLGAPARGEDTAAPYLWLPLTLCIVAMVVRLTANVVNFWRGRQPGLWDLAVMAGVIALYLFVGTQLAG